MGIDWNDISLKSNGGTEQMCRGLEARLPRELMDEFQIVPSRIRNPLQDDKIRILWLHDTAQDPESHHLANGGWRKFHRMVFVSNWQMQHYIDAYDLPWSRCAVLPNAIVPIPRHEKPDGPVKLIYTSTPHRGLNILLAAYKKLRETDEDIALDVFSSFKLYGWPDQDEQFKPLFEELERTEGVTYNGSGTNDEIREALTKAHVFSYPSTWPETSCLCLIEAMSAGLVCVHPNFGGLYETAGNWTYQYQYQEDPARHAATFYEALKAAIDRVRSTKNDDILATQKLYADLFFSWDMRSQEWEGLLRSLLNEPRGFEQSQEFVYQIGE